MTVEFEGVTAGYGDEPVVEDVSLSIGDGELVGFLGPNGVGKSTLLKTVVGLLAPASGTVRVGESAVDDLSRRDLARRVGYVPQSESPTAPTTVFETVLMGRKPYLSWRASTSDHAVVERVLTTLDLDDLAMRDVGSLSGGQRQKVVIARALAQEPDVLVLDEPTSDLDIRHEVDVLDVVCDRVTDGLSGVVAMHDLNLAARFCDRLVLFADHGVYATGPPEILSETSVRDVYGVDATVHHDGDGVTVVPKSGTGR
ncbi:ABC transporter ATP-binding protein [Haloarculaceae archaeon H-GB11]|nr:ABC transporter ATP-binding protein [Haloarculaceae archaeon H-GB11]